MKTFTEFINKTITTDKGRFTESVNSEGKKELYYETLLVPFNKVSRNGVKYNKDSVVEKADTIIGKSLFFNHITDGNDSKDLPRGEWESYDIKPEGMYAKARIFQTKYNQDFIDYLKEAKHPRSSLQISGDAKRVKESDSDEYYTEAYVKEFLESSVVSIPGFDNAHGSLAVAMAEVFNLKETQFKMKDYVFIKADGNGFKRGDQGFVKKVIGKDVTVQLDKNMKNVVVDSDDIILIPKESFELTEDKTNQSHLNDVKQAFIDVKNGKISVQQGVLRINKYLESFEELPKEETETENLFDKLDRVRESIKEADDAIDKIIIDIPLITRLFEYFMEEDVDDVTLHKILENLIMESKNIELLGMDNYENIINVSEDEEPEMGD